MRGRARGSPPRGSACTPLCDTDGNIWSSAGWVGEGYDGVHIFAPNGDRIGQILLPEICSNVCFGGRERNRLFMTASQSLYAVYTETQGAHITQGGGGPASLSSSLAFLLSAGFRAAVSSVRPVPRDSLRGRARRSPSFVRRRSAGCAS